MNPIIEKVRKEMLTAKIKSFREEGDVGVSIARAAIRATLEHLRDNVSEGMIDEGVRSDHGKTLGTRAGNCFQAMLTQALAELDP